MFALKQQSRTFHSSMLRFASRFQKLVAEVSPNVKKINCKDLKAQLATEKRAETTKTLVVDVREPSEWVDGMIPGAVTIPRGVIESQIEGVAVKEDQEIVVYCKTGHRSVLAAEALTKMGYKDVKQLEGGFKLWREQGCPSTKISTKVSKE